MKENCKDRKCRRFIKLYILTFNNFRPAEFHLKSKYMEAFTVLSFS